MPTKVYRSGHSMAQAGLSECSLRRQAWWVKINPIPLLTPNPKLNFLLCQAWTSESQETETTQHFSIWLKVRGCQLWLGEQMWGHTAKRATATNENMCHDFTTTDWCNGGWLKLNANTRSRFPSNVLWLRCSGQQLQHGEEWTINQPLLIQHHH